MAHKMGREKHVINHKSLRPGRPRHSSLALSFLLSFLLLSVPDSTPLSMSVSHQSFLPCSFSTFYPSFLPPSITLSLHPFSLALIPFSYHRLLLPPLLPSDFQYLSTAVLFTVAEIKISTRKNIIKEVL